MSYKDKVVWITGASSGIGEALAKAFAASGAKIILSGRRIEALQAVAEALPTQCMILPFEVTEWDCHEEVANAAWNWSGGVDMLINNAGISQRSLAIDSGFDVYQRVIDIDLMAPIALTQLLIPKMAERGSGHIMGISSVAGRVGVPLRTAYCAAKHGLIGYMDALRAEVESHYGIRVTTVLPGSVQTNIAINSVQADGSTRGSSDPNIDNGLTPEDAVQRIFDAMEAGEREIIVAEGAEASFAALRQSDGNKLFDVAAGIGKQLAEEREQAMTASPEDKVFVPMPGNTN